MSQHVPISTKGMCFLVWAPRLVGVGPGRLVVTVAVALLLLPIVARRVAAALAPRPEDVPVKQRLRGSEPLSPPARARSLAAGAFTGVLELRLPGVLHGSVDGRFGRHTTTTTTTAAQTAVCPDEFEVQPLK